MCVTYLPVVFCVEQTIMNADTRGRTGKNCLANVSTDYTASTLQNKRHFCLHTRVLDVR